MSRFKEICRTCLTRCRQGLQWSRVQAVALWGKAQKRLVPAGKLESADEALLRWVVMCAAVLLPVGVMQLADMFQPLEEWQVKFLLGHPFYLDAQDVQVSLLGRGGVFGLCTLLTLYLSAVLLREKGWGKRSQLCVLALVALALPCMLCVLWNGVLYLAPAMLCVVLLWVFSFVPFFQPDHNAA